MGIVLLPEIKMARRLSDLHSLQIPFDLEALVKKYAKIVYKDIPVEGVDGICLNLKTKGKIPTVIVNDNAFSTRQKFTLAHELGHIIIPWHYGIIVDELDESSTNLNTQYWELEREANRFASELLMPLNWIYEQYKIDRDPENLLNTVCRVCGVSEKAAEIRLKSAISEIETLLMPDVWLIELFNDRDNLAVIHEEVTKISQLSPLRVAHRMTEIIPGKFSFCVEIDGQVIGGGTTSNNPSFIQWTGEKFNSTPYTYFTNHHISILGNINTHWWTFNHKFSVDDTELTWRQLLEKIANDIRPQAEIKEFKATINGKVSGAHGSFKKRYPELGKEELMENLIQRFNNTDFKDFIEHPDFLIFIKKRVEDFFN